MSRDDYSQRQKAKDAEYQRQYSGQRHHRGWRILRQAICGASRPANSEPPPSPSAPWLVTSRFLATATREQRAAMKRDLEPIIHIYNQL